jgi:Domain of Unknown Function (DUF1080)
MFKKLVQLSLLSLSFGAFAQESFPFEDLSAFKKTESNWRIAGGVSANPNTFNEMQTTAGKGVLVCIHPKGQYGNQYDLISNFEHGDLDLSVDVMIAKGSNSGIYLQGRYEVQLFDSWAKKNPAYNDLGGVYERWNESKPEGQKGYEGYAPSSNAAKAPGLWQNIKISFQAPKFDAAGKKTANGKILSVLVNGIQVQQNVELTGPTRGFDQTESAMGSLRIQGDHGCVAFKNLQIKNFNQNPPTVSDISYKTFEGPFKKMEEMNAKTPLKTGTLKAITYEVLTEENNFGLQLVGKMQVPVAGKYTVSVSHGGTFVMNINGKEVMKEGWNIPTNTRKATTELPAGESTFDIGYIKTDAWVAPKIAVSIESDHVRQSNLHTPSSAILANPAMPILMTVGAEPLVHRSFIDYPKPAKKVVHAVSVGNKERMHFSYDLDNGSLFQVWRGEFLDATPMWNSRGDGTSKPMGFVQTLGLKPSLMVLADKTLPWAEAVAADFLVKGYELDENGQPTFKYKMGETMVQDKITPNADATAFIRKISVSGGKDIVCRLADAKKITKVSDGYFMIDNAYYIIAPSASIRDSNGNQELISNVYSELQYSIAW